MPDYNVKVIVDVQGKKVMDELAKGKGGNSGGGAGGKSLSGAVGTATKGIMSGEGLSSVFETLTASITGMTVVIGVAVGILLMAVSNSKVVAYVFGTIGKLLGFLLDIILLPLMPFFIQLVRWLYQLIIEFRNFTKNLTLKSILSFGLDILMLTTPLGWVVKLIQWALGDGNIQDSIDFTFALLKGAGDWLWSVAEWIWGVNMALVNTDFNISMSIGTAIAGFLAGAADFALSILKWIFGLVTPQNTSITLDFIANLVGDAWKTVQSLAGSAGATVTSALSSAGSGIGSLLHSITGLDSGGTVAQTGLAVVHKGETYSGVNGSGKAGGGNTYNFNNYGNTKTEYELFQRFMSLMRQQGQGLKL